MCSDCPKADDPITPGKDEEQILDCQCPGTCSGYFTLSFRGQTTARIPYDATAEFLKYRLEVSERRHRALRVVMMIDPSPPLNIYRQFQPLQECQSI